MSVSPPIEPSNCLDLDAPDSPPVTHPPRFNIHGALLSPITFRDLISESVRDIKGVASKAAISISLEESTHKWIMPSQKPSYQICIRSYVGQGILYKPLSSSKPSGAFAINSSGRRVFSKVMLEEEFPPGFKESRFSIERLNHLFERYLRSHLILNPACSDLSPEAKRDLMVESVSRDFGVIFVVLPSSRIEVDEPPSEPSELSSGSSPTPSLSIKSILELVESATETENSKTDLSSPVSQDLIEEIKSAASKKRNKAHS